MTELRLGIDIGGTFTDLAVSSPHHGVKLYKSPTTRHDYREGIFACLTQAAEDLGTSVSGLLEQRKSLVHGSTVATNAVIQRRGAKVGLLCTRGHRYVLWRREGGKEDVFNHHVDYRRALIEPRFCFELDERINSEGGVERPLVEDEARRVIRGLRAFELEAVAVSLLWAPANDAHEHLVARLLEEELPGMPYSLSSEVQPVVGEYARTACVALNAMLIPMMREYIGGLEEALDAGRSAGGLLLVTSSGGSVTPSKALSKPVLMCASGPSMAPRAAAGFAAEHGAESCIVTDMGGTSFDVSILVDGRPLMTRDAEVGHDKTGLTSVEVSSLGAGGGSIAWVDSGGLLHVGPRSAEAVPGPACYGRGGTEPTVTDANVVLGYIDADGFLDGRLHLRSDLAYEAIERAVATPLGISVEAAASGIHRVVNENMIGGIFELTTQRGLDPSELSFVAGGGSGGLHAVNLARALGSRTVVIPRVAPAICAAGMLVTDVLFGHDRTLFTTSEAFAFDQVNALLAELRAQAKSELDAADIAREDQSAETHVAMRYAMQMTELEVELVGEEVTPESVLRLLEKFHAEHAARYGVSERQGASVEFVHWRVAGIGRTHGVALVSGEDYLREGLDAKSAMKGVRQIWEEASGKFESGRVYDGAQLRPGMSVSAPAVIDDRLTTVLIAAGADARVSPSGSYVVELAGGVA